MGTTRNIILFILNYGHHIIQSFIKSFKFTDRVSLYIVYFDLAFVLVLWFVLIFFLHNFFEAARLTKLNCHFAGTSIIASFTGELDPLNGGRKNL